MCFIKCIKFIYVISTISWYFVRLTNLKWSVQRGGKIMLTTWYDINWVYFVTFSCQRPVCILESSAISCTRLILKFQSINKKDQHCPSLSGKKKNMKAWNFVHSWPIARIQLNFLKIQIKQDAGLDTPNICSCGFAWIPIFFYDSDVS